MWRLYLSTCSQTLRSESRKSTISAPRVWLSSNQLSNGRLYISLSVRKLGKGNIESRPLFSPPRLAQFKSIAEWQLAISTNPQRESRQNRPFLHRVWSSSVQFSCRVEGNLSACSQTLQSLLIISPLCVDQVNSVQFLNAFLTLFLSHVILHE